MLGGNCGGYSPYDYDQGPCCSPDCSKVWSGVLQVSVTIAAGDVVRKLEQTFQSPGVPPFTPPYTIHRKTSDVAWGSLLDGTHILTKTGSFSSWSEWRADVAGQPASCSSSFFSNITMRLYHQPSNNASGRHYDLEIVVPGAFWADSKRSDGVGGCSDPQFYTAAEMNCTAMNTTCRLRGRQNKGASFWKNCSAGVYGAMLPSATVSMSGFSNPSVSSDWTLLSQTETYEGETSITIEGVTFE